MRFLPSFRTAVLVAIAAALLAAAGVVGTRFSTSSQAAPACTDEWIQGQLDALPRGVGIVPLPNTVCELDEAVVLASEQGLEGTGRGATVLRLTSPTAGIVVDGSEAPARSPYLAQLSIDCDGTAPVGLDVVGAKFGAFEHLSISGCTDVGVRLRRGGGEHSSTDNVFESIEVRDSATAVRLVREPEDSPGGSQGSSRNTFRNIRGTRFTTVGMHIASGEGNSCYSCSMHAAPGTSGLTGFLVEDNVTLLVHPDVGGGQSEGLTGVHLTPTAGGSVVILPKNNAVEVFVKNEAPRAIVIRSLADQGDGTSLPLWLLE